MVYNVNSLLHAKNFEEVIDGRGRIHEAHLGPDHFGRVEAPGCSEPANSASRILLFRPIGSSNQETTIPVRSEFELVIGAHQATAASSTSADFTLLFLFPLADSPSLIWNFRFGKGNGSCAPFVSSDSEAVQKF
uniref:Uncharacterized protein n=1 Tax=Solanum lycopersicum TaxID=4081 RepID=A0A3Q7HT28_SOLLC